MFSGGALERLSIFALGIFPYISCSIVMQMASVTIPILKSLKRKASLVEERSRNILDMGRFLAAFQSFGASIALQNQGVVVTPGFNFLFTACVTLVTGTMFLMWLGSRLQKEVLEMVSL